MSHCHTILINTLSEKYKIQQTLKSVKLSDLNFLHVRIHASGSTELWKEQYWNAIEGQCNNFGGKYGGVSGQERGKHCSHTFPSTPPEITKPPLFIYLLDLWMCTYCMYVNGRSRVPINLHPKLALDSFCLGCVW